jgi:fatty-acyl-CoA synthase
LQYSGSTAPIPGSVGVAYPFHAVVAAELAANRFVRLSEPGETGTLLLCGPAMTPGYGAPSGNEKLFIEGGPDGKRWASSGDLGIVDEAGFVWVYGRAKDLIIRGGHNIEPLIIESAAEAHEDILLAAAVGLPDRTKGELPVIYVQVKEGREVTAQALLNHCRSRISERAAVPVEAIILAQMPTTAIGKVDKPALRRQATRTAAERAAREVFGNCALRIDYDDRRGRPVAIIYADHPELSGPALIERVHKAFSGFAFTYRLLPFAEASVASGD